MAFKPSASKKNSRKQEATLNMNSLMDVLTIMLLFLLMSFSTEGALVTATETLQPPRVISKSKPKKAAVISISQNEIIFNEEPVAQVQQVYAQNQPTVVNLLNKMKSESTKALELENSYGIEFSREVIIWADKGTPFKILMKVIVTCGQASFINLKFMGPNVSKTDLVK